MDGEPESHGEEHPSEQSGEGASGEPVQAAWQALDDLQRLHEENPDEFFRVAAVREFGPEMRQALEVLLTLSPEALQTLAEVVRLPAPDQHLIRRTLGLSAEVQDALRGLLID